MAIAYRFPLEMAAEVLATPTEFDRVRYDFVVLMSPQHTPANIEFMSDTNKTIADIIKRVHFQTKYLIHDILYFDRP